MAIEGEGHMGGGGDHHLLVSTTRMAIEGEGHMDGERERERESQKLLHTWQ
jgi:hypothetical protein